MNEETSRPIKKTMELTREEYYEKHLTIVNSIVPLDKRATHREIEVLSRFMSLKGDIASDRFGTSARKLVKQSLSLTDGALGNFLRGLRDKGFVIPNSQGVEIVNPLLNVAEGNQVYMFHIIIKDDNPTTATS